MGPLLAGCRVTQGTARRCRLSGSNNTAICGVVCPLRRCDSGSFHRKKKARHMLAEGGKRVTHTHVCVCVCVCVCVPSSLPEADRVTTPQNVYKRATWQTNQPTTALNPIFPSCPVFVYCKSELQLLSQCGSTCTCLSRSVRETHKRVAGTLSKPTNQQ